MISSRDLEKWVHLKFEVIGQKSHKGDIPCRCPECGDDRGKFSVNVEKRVFNCWRGSCGYKGNTLEPLFRRFGPPNDDYHLEEENVEEVKEESSNLITPEGYKMIWRDEFVPVPDCNLLTGIQIKEFLRSRKISFSASLGLRYCSSRFEGDKEYGVLKDYIGIPYGDPISPSYFQYRINPLYEGGKRPKWRFPKAIGDFDKKNFIYVTPGPLTNYAILMESALDSIRVSQATGITCVSLGGAYIHPSQMREISSKFRLVIAMMDGDTGGRDAVFGKDGRPGIADTVLSFTSLSVYVPPSWYFSLGKDPDEMESSEILNVIHSCSPFNPSCASNAISGDLTSFQSLRR